MKINKVNYDDAFYILPLLAFHRSALGWYVEFGWLWWTWVAVEITKPKE